MRVGPLVPAGMLLSASAAFAAERIAPSDIQATFFNGQQFTCFNNVKADLSALFDYFRRRHSRDLLIWTRGRSAAPVRGDTKTACSTDGEKV